MIALGGAAVAWPLATRAQQPVPLVGLLNSEPSTEQLRVDSFIKRFRELGWIEGYTVAIESRWAEGRPERVAEIAAEFVRLKVSVIVTSGAGPVSAVRQATQFIPIVFAIATDPVATGLVATLARPGGNITGLSYMGTDLASKRLEFLRGAIAGLARLGIMAHNAAAGALLEMRETQITASTRGLEAITLEITAANEIASAIERLKNRVDALYVCPDPLINANRARIVTSVLAAGLPTIFGERENVDAGGLMSYGPNVPDMYRRAAEIVDKILRGTKPADITVEQPTQFELVINLKAAKTLGLTIPQSLLSRADEIVE